MLYAPRSSVTTVRIFSISSGLAASTVTPGRTAPLVSFTTPVIVLAVWARAFAGHNARHAHVMTMNPNRDLLISGPPKDQCYAEAQQRRAT
jgi:hypothetical protein